VTALVARARTLGPAFDLLANYRPGGFFFERAGVGVSTIGIAGRIGVEGGPERLPILAREVETVLRAVRVSGDGPAPIAVGAIPFDAGWPAHLVVPERSVIRRAPGRTEQLDVVPEGTVEVTPSLSRASSGTKRWYERWWVWAIIGGVVAGSATTVAILTRPAPENVDAVVRWPQR